MIKNALIKHLVLTSIIFGTLACQKLKFFNSSPKTDLLGVVERGDLSQRVTIAGTVAPVRSTNIAAPYTGYVKELFVKVGDRVKKGTPIVSVAQSLLSSQPVYPMQSPLNGYVVQINKAEGEFVKGDDNRDFILRIDDPSEYIIKADTPEIDRIKVKVGQKALIKVNAILQKNYKGLITTVARAPTVRDSWRSSTVDYATTVQVLDPDSDLHTGMTALIDLLVDKRENVLLLRHEFVHKDSKGYFVLLETGERKDIQVGLQNEEAFEVTQGLNEGEKIQPIDFARLGEKRP